MSLDLQAIQERDAAGEDLPFQVREDRNALIAEVERLTAHLDRVRAVRDYIDVRKDWPAPRWVLLERLDRALDGEATE